MTEITFILPDGGARVVDVDDGMSVMQAAIMDDIKGIDGECGGCCSCATCHVYVESLNGGALPPIDDTENGLLDGVAAERRENSRLGCQITVSSELHGLVLRIPERQV